MAQDRLRHGWKISSIRGKFSIDIYIFFYCLWIDRGARTVGGIYGLHEEDARPEYTVTEDASS